MVVAGTGTAHAGYWDGWRPARVMVGHRVWHASISQHNMSIPAVPHHRAHYVPCCHAPSELESHHIRHTFDVGTVHVCLPVHKVIGVAVSTSLCMGFHMHSQIADRCRCVETAEYLSHCALTLHPGAGCSPWCHSCPSVCAFGS